MNGMRSVWNAIGAFWCVTILVVVVGAGVFVGLWKLGWILQENAVGHQARINNAQYNATRNTQAYQDTYVSQTDKAFQQLRADMWNTAQAVQQHDDTMITEGNAEIASDETIFCKDAQKLTATSLDSLGPQEHTFYLTHC